MIARETEVDIYTLSHNCVWYSIPLYCIPLKWEQRILHQVSRMLTLQSVRDQRTPPLINNKLYFTLIERYLAGLQQWNLLHRCCRPAGLLSQEERSGSTPCDQISPHWDWVLYIMIMIMGGTSCCRGESSWCCLPPKRGRRQV